MTAFDNITDKEYEDFSRQFYRRSGIKLTPEKKYLITNRLQKLIKAENNIHSFSDLSRIIAEGRDKELIAQFVDALTTNYSYFFRDPVHFRFLKYFFTHKADDKTRIRIWSAACSSGEEPYSIALILHEFFPEFLKRDVHIHASDISQKMLLQATNGIYKRESLIKNINDSTLIKYFEVTEKDQYYGVKHEVKKLISFQKINLMEPYPFRDSFDIIFLRNVLIYFDQEKKEQILSNLAHYLNKDGYLIISMSESLVGLRQPFKHIQNSIYRL